MTEQEIRKIVSETVEETLMRIGVDAENPIEYQKDMAYLRSWRNSTGTIKSQSLIVAIGIITSGFLGLLWMTFTQFVQGK